MFNLMNSTREEPWRRAARLKLSELEVEAGADRGQRVSSQSALTDAIIRKNDLQRSVEHLERQNLMTGGRFKDALHDARALLADAEEVCGVMRQRHDRLCQAPSHAGNLFHRCESIARILEITK